MVIMSHKPIQIKNLSLSFPYKTCFENFTTQVSYGSRIAIIGRNGSGKSTFLKIMQGMFQPTMGSINIPDDVIFGYVPKVIQDFESLSGGQRLNESLTQAFRLDPNVLLLDEPTNHLDCHNRKTLMRRLHSYLGTLIVVSHDVELLRHCIDRLWHIDDGQIHIFSGNYDDYVREVRIKRTFLKQELSRLNRQKKDTHQALMKEQDRAAKRKIKGEKAITQRKWPTVTSHAKAGRAQETSGRKKAAIDHKKQDLTEELSNLRLPEVIVPTFSLSAFDVSDRIFVCISEGAVGYHHQCILKNIHLSLSPKDRITIIGNNGSGKSTIIKAILDDPHIVKTGNWCVPKQEDIGYLDQHYDTLSPQQSVLETITDLVPTWSHAEVRRHLNHFLFRKNEEVNTKTKELSGGEKLRLSLAKIAARTPKMLILDEITNNLDLETRAHVVDVLSVYPGAMIVISHDEDFLKAINIIDYYVAGDLKLERI